MNSLRGSRSGFAVVVVVLVMVVAIGAVVSAASLAALAARQVASAEQRTTQAFLAAESGLNSILAKARDGDPGVRFDSIADVGEDGLPDINAWMRRIGADSYDLPGGAEVSLTAIEHPTITNRVTIRSTGSAAGESVRIILQDFRLATPDGLDPYAGPLISIPRITGGGNATLLGLTSDAGDWVFENRPLSWAYVDEYAFVDDELYRVDGILNAGTPLVEVELVAVHGDTVPQERLEDGATLADLVPYALAEDVSTAMTQIPVSNVSLFPPGATVYVGESNWSFTVQERDSEAGLLRIEWSAETPIGDANTVPEGSPLRLEIPSAISDVSGGCLRSTHPQYPQLFPQECVTRDLGDLFATTFNGLTELQVRNFAASNPANLALGGGLYEGTWPLGGVVSGVSWIDGAGTGSSSSVGLCGDGIVVLNTGTFDVDDGVPEDAARININVSDDCPFTGVLYIIGQLGLQGNIDNISGSILVEGPANFTNVTGTGDKSIYDPIAVRRALDMLPSGIITGLESRLPNSWRFQ